MGKLLLRRLIEMGLEKQLVLINEVNGDADCFAHQLEFDTVHGHFDAKISTRDGKLKLGRHSVAVSHARKVAAIPLEDNRVDFVIDCTGAHRTKKTLEKYFAFGVKKVLVACPASKPAINLVFGVNHDLYDPKDHHIVTAASCTTNCIAPIVQVLHESIGIEHGSITTIHNATNTQTLVDRPGNDIRRSRSGVNSMFP